MESDSSKLDFLSVALVLACLSFVGLYLFTVAKRIPYPYELEWMEGTMLTHSIRLSEGKSIYIAPSAEFIPYLYTPFYSITVAGFMTVLGKHLWVGRLVSAIASFFAACLIYQIVYKESRKFLAGLTAAALFLATYRFTGTWMDIVRVDAFQLFLLLLGFYLVRNHTKTLLGIILAAGIFTLAYFTKQSAPIFLLTAGLALFLENKRKALQFLFSFAILTGVIILIANYYTGNWFWIYTHSIITGSILYKFSIAIFIDYFINDLMLNIPIMLLLIVAWYGYQFRNMRQVGQSLFWSLAFAAGFASSLLMRSKPGGYTNSYMTLCCFGSILVGLLLAKSSRFKPWVRVMIVLVILVQFYRLAYNPFNQIPTQADHRSGKTVIDKIASFKGPVLVISHPYYPLMAGKKMNMQDQALQDLLDSGYSIPEDLTGNIRKKYYNAIIMDEFDDGYETRHTLLGLVEESYYLAERIFKPEDKSFFPVTGYWARPVFVYLPKDI